MWRSSMVLRLTSAVRRAGSWSNGAILRKCAPPMLSPALGQRHVSKLVNDRSEYRKYQVDRKKLMQSVLNRPDRYQSIEQREDKSVLPPEFIQSQCAGRYIMVYRGCQTMKSPDDQALYHQLLYYIKPATVIEIGSNSGGFTLWMSDILKLIDVECQVYSMDIDLSLLEPQVKKLQPDNLHFIQGDSFAIEKTFTPEMMTNMKHPILVIEDAHVNVQPLLTYFHKFLKQGDYFVVEDCNPDIPAVTGMGCLYEEYEPFGPEKLKDLRSFLTEYKDWYAVDSFFTDFFGYNATWNWHGFIRKMK